MGGDIQSVSMQMLQKCRLFFSLLFSCTLIFFEDIVRALWFKYIGRIDNTLMRRAEREDTEMGEKCPGLG